MSVADKLSLIAENQTKVFEAGYEKGKIDSNYEEAYEAGQKSEYDRFWDVYQSNGTRRDYQYAFAGAGWTSETTNPKYSLDDIVINNTYMMFARCKIEDIATTFPKLVANYAQYIFYNADVTKHIGEVTIRDAAYGAFTTCKVLETIDKLTITNKAEFVSCFNNCNALKNIVIEGSIENSINFQWSPLTPASMKSIISCLKDFSGTTSAGTKTITFNDACWAELEADSSSPAGGTWEDYVTSLGWNV